MMDDPKIQKSSCNAYLWPRKLLRSQTKHTRSSQGILPLYLKKAVEKKKKNNNQGIGGFSANLLATKKYLFEWSPPWCTILTQFLTYHLEVCTAYLFWHSIWHSFWHLLWHFIWPSSICSDLYWHSLRRLAVRSGSAHWHQQLAVEIRQCPRRRRRRRERRREEGRREGRKAGGEQQTWALSALIMNRTSFQ